MKKTVLFAAAIFTVSAATAQTGEITSAKGENWLSQDGDWGLTFEATPLLNYAGNLFNGGNNTGVAAINGFNGNNLLNGNTLFNTTSGNNVVIAGKKLVDANTAYRGRFRIGFGSQKNTEMVAQDPQPSGSTTIATVEDVEKNNFFALNLGFGLEKRVGSTRVVGIYGAELNIGFGNSKQTYEYGSPLSNDNPDHTDTFGQGAGVTEKKNGSSFGVGLNAFAGVEWFAAPKISLSAEYAWGLALVSQGLGSTTVETWNPANNGSLVTTESDLGQTKQSTFSLDTGVNGGRIGVNFYFQ